MRLNLWRLIGSLTIDDRGYLRYRVTFGSAAVARSVVQYAGSCHRRRGQVLWTGGNVWYGLSLMGAPGVVVAAARAYARAGPDLSGNTTDDLMAVLEEHMEVVDELAE